MTTKYEMDIKIIIVGEEAKKDAVRDAINQKLQDAKIAGQITEATWTITKVEIPELGAV